VEHIPITQYNLLLNQSINIGNFIQGAGFEPLDENDKKFNLKLEYLEFKKFKEAENQNKGT